MSMLTIIVALMSIVGCASESGYLLTKPGEPQSVIAQDEAYCETWASSSQAYKRVWFDQYFIGPKIWLDQRTDCLISQRGWKKITPQ